LKENRRVKAKQGPAECWMYAMEVLDRQKQLFSDLRIANTTLDISNPQIDDLCDEMILYIPGVKK
jgi:hypothetical protein